MTKPVVLAVDDDATNLEIVEAILEDSELDVRLMGGGEEALRFLKSGAPVDLMLLDRMMPVVDGITVLRQMKQDPRLSDVPVVMQTAAAAPSQVEEGLKAGAYYYLTKPYSPEALRTIVSSALEDGVRRRRLKSSANLNALLTLESGSFSARSLDEAEALAEALSLLCPDPGAAWTGLHELLANAVEHGNLCISYSEKARLKLENRWREEVRRREGLPEYSARRVWVRFERSSDSLTFIIRDEGAGFAWRDYLDFDAARAFDPNGRGIALARAMCFHDLHYLPPGNTAVARVALPTEKSRN